MTNTLGMLLKLDLSKYFDKLNYIRSTLIAFGFNLKWVNWILNLTSLAFLYILINGVPSWPFSPSRGIHQGDPLSSFLFIIMAEGLNHSIKAVMVEKSLTGFPLHGISPPISHNQFVDGTLIMGVPTVCKALQIRDTLQTFYDASLMDINKDKLQIFFFSTLTPVQFHMT